MVRNCAPENPFLLTFRRHDGFRACAYGASRNDGAELLQYAKYSRLADEPVFPAGHTHIPALSRKGTELWRFRPQSGV